MAVFFKKKSSTEGESTNHRKVPERSNRVRVKNCFPFDCFSVLTDDNYKKKEGHEHLLQITKSKLVQMKPSLPLHPHGFS